MVYDISIILKAEEGTHRAMLWDAALKRKQRAIRAPCHSPLFANPLKRLANDMESDFVLMIIGRCIENRCTPEQEVRGQLRSVQ